MTPEELILWVNGLAVIATGGLLKLLHWYLHKLIDGLSKQLDVFQIELHHISEITDKSLEFKAMDSEREKQHTQWRDALERRLVEGHTGDREWKYKYLTPTLDDLKRTLSILEEKVLQLEKWKNGKVYPPDK